MNQKLPSKESEWIVIFKYSYLVQENVKHSYQSDLKRFPSLEAASTHGFHIIGCDDFCIVELQEGKAVALWDEDGKLSFSEDEITEINDQLNL